MAGIRIINNKSTTHYLVLTDDNGNAYTFNQTFFVQEDALDSRSDVTDIMFGSGGIQSADGFVPSRKITIEGNIQSEDEDDFETKMRAFAIAMKKGGILTINDDVVDRYIEVRNAKRNPDWKRYQACKKVTVTFTAEFPYWQDSTDNIETVVVAGDDDFDVDASGSDDIMMPIITITADQGVDVPGIKLTNLDDGGLYFKYNNPEFYAGSELVIDCAEGTIMLDGNDARNCLVEGSSYLRLQSMINSFQYEGAACTIDVAFKKVYE